MIKKIVSFCILMFFMLECTFAANQSTFRLVGVKGKARENVEMRIDGILKNYPLPENHRRLMQVLPKEVQEALKPYGYFSPRVRITTNTPSKFIIFIDMGPATRITRVEKTIIGPGKNDPELIHYFDHFPIQPGNILISPVYEKAKEKAFAIANQRGYIKAQFTTSKILISTQKHSAAIFLEMQTGPRFYIGKINIENNPYSDAFVQRMLSIDEGEPFSSERILTLQQSLLNSPYFNKVLAIPDMSAVQHETIPITLNLDAPKAKKFGFGLGYGTLTGLRLTANVALQHLTETGQYFDAQLKLSNVISGIAAKYHIPAQNPLTDEWILGIEAERFNPKNGESRSATFQGGYKKKYENVEVKYFLNYLLEHYKMQHEPMRTSRLLYPELSLDYVNVDDPIHTKNGVGLNFQIKGASETVLSSTNFLQSQLNIKYLFSPTYEAHILLRGALGLTLVQDTKDLPLSMFFFAGGSNSIRGYKDSSIGPGRYLELGSVELRHRIKGHWTGAVFFDAGSASNDLKGKVYKSTGLGVIYESVIGPIKIYAAHPLNKGERAFSVEFSIGPEF